MLGLQLVDEIRQHTHTLAKYAEFIAATTDSKFSIVQSKLKDLEKSLDLQISSLRTETVSKIQLYVKSKILKIPNSKKSSNQKVRYQMEKSKTLTHQTNE